MPMPQAEPQQQQQDGGAFQAAMLGFLAGLGGDRVASQVEANRQRMWQDYARNQEMALRAVETAQQNQRFEAQMDLQRQSLEFEKTKFQTAQNERTMGDFSRGMLANPDAGVFTTPMSEETFGAVQQRQGRSEDRAAQMDFQMGVETRGNQREDKLRAEGLAKEQAEVDDMAGVVKKFFPEGMEGFGKTKGGLDLMLKLEARNEERADKAFAEYRKRHGEAQEFDAKLRSNAYLAATEQWKTQGGDFIKSHFNKVMDVLAPAYSAQQNGLLTPEQEQEMERAEIDMASGSPGAASRAMETLRRIKAPASRPAAESRGAPESRTTGGGMSDFGALAPKKTTDLDKVATKRADSESDSAREDVANREAEFGGAIKRLVREDASALETLRQAYRDEVGKGKSFVPDDDSLASFVAAAVDQYADTPEPSSKYGGTRINAPERHDAAYAVVKMVRALRAKKRR